jgi:AraC-like DNA-binding protein
MSLALSFDTADVAMQHRLSVWNEWADQHLGGARALIEDISRFHGKLMCWQVGDVSITRVASNALELEAKASLKNIQLIAPSQGSVQVHQNGATVGVKPGQWVVPSPTQGYQLRAGQSHEQLIVQLPRSAITRETLEARPLGTQPFGQDRIAQATLRTLNHSLLSFDSMNSQSHIKTSDLIQHLVRMTFLESPFAGQANPDSNLALFDRARFYVLQHLRDNDLNPDRVASALNCSRRALYYAFQSSGESIAAYIQRERLQACVRNLQDERHPAAPITEIAVSWGFTNLSHFSRVFKDKTGSSPTEFRKTRS